MSEARKIAEFDVPKGADASLLTDQVMKASETKISNIRISEPKVEGKKANVKVDYSLGDAKHDITLQAHKNGREGLFFDKWTLTAPEITTIRVSSDSQRDITVDSVRVRLPEEMEGTYAVLPGSYKVEIPGSTYFSGDTKTAAVNFGPASDSLTGDSVTLERKPKDNLKTEITRQVKTLLNRCIASRRVHPSGCPMDENQNSQGYKVKENSVNRKAVGEPSVTVYSSPAVRRMPHWRLHGGGGARRSNLDDDNGPYPQWMSPAPR